MFIEKFQKGWEELDSEIIKAGKCLYCGACGAFCANIKFDTNKEIVDHAINNKNIYEPQIVTALRVLYNNNSINKPYLLKK